MKKYIKQTPTQIPETKEECEVMNCDDCGMQEIIEITDGPDGPDRCGCQLCKFLRKAEAAK